MIKRIDLFLPPPNLSQYGVLHHFTKKFHEALLRIGINARILEAQHDNPKPFLAELFKDVPDCTFSFNGLLPDDEGRFFADLIHIPHVAYVVDSPNGYVSLANSPFTIIASVDQNACDFFRGIHAKNVLFLPHGVEKNINLPHNDERPFDVVMLSSCIDYEMIQKEWKNKYPEDLRKILEEAVETTLADEKTSYVQAFVNAMDKKMATSGGLDPNKMDFIDILDQLEMVVRGRERVALIRHITDARVDIFGSSAPTTTWKKQLNNQSNVIVHDAVPFDQALEIMQKTKILLSSCAWLKRGVHERTLSGLASGALVFTAESQYMHEHFSDNKNIAFFKYSALSEVNSRVNTYLKDPELRLRIALKGREQVIHNHTWDHRAATLVKELDPLLKTLKAFSQ